MAISLFDHLNRTFVSYLVVVLTAVALITILFLLDHKKMTFDLKMIRIQTPFLKSSNFCNSRYDFLVTASSSTQTFF